ncbi:hypothetical protein [Lamprocystis purpurea]|nr:hypothetical protein [Lamprocystis purpurea]
MAYAGVQRFWYRLSYDWITAWNFSHRKAAAGYLDLSYCDVPD